MSQSPHHEDKLQQTIYTYTEFNERMYRTEKIAINCVNCIFVCAYATTPTNTIFKIPSVIYLMAAHVVMINWG